MFQTRTRDKAVRSLFAGPYDYEFGHELFSFQGYIRKLSRGYEKTVVCSKKCMEFLYKDFVDEFVPLGNPDNRPQLGGAYKKVTMEDCRAAVSSGTGIFKYDQEFVQYGKQIDERYDVIVHARTKDMGGPMSINLEQEAYNILNKELSLNYRVAFIGSKSDAYCPAGALDLRGIEMSRLVDIIYSSKLVVGQSSGPIHLASLCTTPHLTWSGYRLRTYARYAHHWNPFKTLCFLLEDLTGNYLSSRIRKIRLPRDILEREYFNVIDTKNYRQPSANELLLYIQNTLELKKLNEYNQKRLLRDTD